VNDFWEPKPGCYFNQQHWTLEEATEYCATGRYPETVRLRHAALWST
jgi:hypothetical protein